MSGDPLQRLTPIVRLAPAKLNLTLAVVGRRANGFHELHSVAVPLALADRLSLAPAAGGTDTLHASGHDAGPIEANLVLRAIAAARTAIGRGADTVALAARLEKRIPVEAGLGGGSSDAAAALDAALEAWRAEPTLVDLLAIAARLGSDVPFFLAGGPALIEGRGERVTALPPLDGPAPGVLLVTPGVAVSTAATFLAFASGGAAAPVVAGATRLTSAHLASEWRAGLRSADLLARAGVLAVANDLAAATEVIAPGVVALRRALTRLIGRPIGQSGSGPSLWALYPSLDEAEAAAEAVRDAHVDGRLAVPGDRPPSIVATTIMGRDETAGESRPAREEAIEP